MTSPGQIASLFRAAADPAAALRPALELILAHFNSETGTIHTLDRKAQTLHLAVQIGLPPGLVETVNSIPVGKGIAGQTVARGEPVTICNLQADGSGVAPPGARASGVGGALCVPIRNGDQIIGTLGIGTRRQHEYTPVEVAELQAMGREIGAALPGPDRAGRTH